MDPDRLNAMAEYLHTRNWELLRPGYWRLRAMEEHVDRCITLGTVTAYAIQKTIDFEAEDAFERGKDESP